MGRMARHPVHMRTFVVVVLVWVAGSVSLGALWALLAASARQQPVAAGAGAAPVTAGRVRVPGPRENADRPTFVDG